MPTSVSMLVLRWCTFLYYTPVIVTHPFGLSGTLLQLLLLPHIRSRDDQSLCAVTHHQALTAQSYHHTEADDENLA
jgi:hypothetical protein